MSERDPASRPAKRAVALHYGESDTAPVIVASGMGYLAEKIVETAADSGVPIYEDNSLATIISQLQLGQEDPREFVSGDRRDLRLLPPVRPGEAGRGRRAAADLSREGRDSWKIF